MPSVSQIEKMERKGVGGILRKIRLLLPPSPPPRASSISLPSYLQNLPPLYPVIVCFFYLIMVEFGNFFIETSVSGIFQLMMMSNAGPILWNIITIDIAERWKRLYLRDWKCSNKKKKEFAGPNKCR